VSKEETISDIRRELNWWRFQFTELEDFLRHKSEKVFLEWHEETLGRVEKFKKQCKERNDQ
jgi:hypothetical protein